MRSRYLRGPFSHAALPRRRVRLAELRDARVRCSVDEEQAALAAPRIVQATIRRRREEASGTSLRILLCSLTGFVLAQLPRSWKEIVGAVTVVRQMLQRALAKSLRIVRSAGTTTSLVGVPLPSECEVGPRVSY